MKAKTIKKILTTKRQEWIKSIDDDDLRGKLFKDTIITGGCIASMLLDEPVNDYDIYFTNKTTLVKVVKYYIQKFKQLNPESELGITYEDTDDRVTIKVRRSSRESMASEDGFNFTDDPYEDLETHAEAPNQEKPKYRPVYLSANAITLSDKIQLVIRFYGDPETIHSNYDFEHCKCYMHRTNLVLPAKSLEALLTKELVYTGSKYPLASIIRTRKFIKRGFKINAGQYLKMALQLNDLDLMHLPTLEDQLIGMDAVYFAQILAAIPPEAKINDRIDSYYVIGIINRFF